MFGPNDNIQIAIIGAGGMGQGDTHLATSLPGVKCVAACDLYTGRLDRMKEVYGTGPLHDPRLQRDSEPQRHRRRDHRHAGSLACAHLHRRVERGQARVLREAHGARDRRGRRGSSRRRTKAARCFRSAASIAAL